MKFKTLLDDVKKEIEQDEIDAAKRQLKEMMLEIKEAKTIVSKLEKKFDDLMEREIFDE